ncbi:chaperonin 10-like protein [Apodospora peruviana]|uniref:Chaperonin 10-like protein n=1 Tax=Apodospora peruviana TaxID=516989 RepID=A0AAE0I5U7_9PEZI|nr:chaperonin 10-like protein [Apodospora peruviana]
MKLPSLQKAITQSIDGSPQLTDSVPLPSLKPGTVIVKTVAVALNPTDNKMGAAFPTPGALVGTDFSGTIVAIHHDTKTYFVVGDRVCGAVHGSNPGNPSNGAFAEYVRIRPELLYRVPASGMTMKEAATLGIGLATNIMALWDSSALGLGGFTPESPAPDPGFPVLVYGGSTATGTLAIQLLRLSGLDPIVTCSPRNFELVRSRGASPDSVFDYVDPGLVDSIKKRAGGRLKYAYDCIGDATSAAHCYAALSRLGGRYVCLEKVPDEVLHKRRAVRSKLVIAYEANGEHVPLPEPWGTKADPTKFALAAGCTGMLQRLLDQGLLKTHPVQEVEGGLEGALRGLKLLKSGEVWGKKLVVAL